MSRQEKSHLIESNRIVRKIQVHKSHRQQTPDGDREYTRHGSRVVSEKTTHEHDSCSQHSEHKMQEGKKHHEIIAIDFSDIFVAYNNSNDGQNIPHNSNNNSQVWHPADHNWRKFGQEDCQQRGVLSFQKIIVWWWWQHTPKKPSPKKTFTTTEGRRGVGIGPFFLTQETCCKKWI